MFQELRQLRNTETPLLWQSGSWGPGDVRGGGLKRVVKNCAALGWSHPMAMPGQVPQGPGGVHFWKREVKLPARSKGKEWAKLSQVDTPRQKARAPLLPCVQKPGTVGVKPKGGAGHKLI